MEVKIAREMYQVWLCLIWFHLPADSEADTKSRLPIRAFVATNAQSGCTQLQKHAQQPVSHRHQTGQQGKNDNDKENGKVLRGS